MAGRRGRIGLVALGVSTVLTGCSIEPIADPGLPEPAESSLVFAADGSLIAAFHGAEDRFLVPIAQIPVALQHAVVATEDARFYTHGGIDIPSIIRAAREDIEAGEIVEGGSTITQQYVKLTITGDEQSLRRKLREAIVALRLERTLTKDEILERYLNIIYFGAGAYGVQAAARTFFDLDVSELTLGQAALLAGMIASPSSYDPLDNPAAALARRSYVLERMVDTGFIDAATAAAASAEELTVHRPKPDIDATVAPYFVDYVKRLLLDDPRLGATRDERVQRLFSGGLRIYTTLDPDMQAAAEEAVSDVLNVVGDPYAALVAIEPSTGYVRAIVGGRDFYSPDDPFAQFNLAVQGHRQAGSAFKPFVLAAALEQGESLAEVWPGGQTVTLDTATGPWTVENYNGEVYGDLSLLDATVSSVNVVYAQVVQAVGADAVVDVAHRMGIASPLEAVDSIALGTQDVTPLEMASAYGTLANRGTHVEPVAITRVEDSTGTLVFDAVPLYTEALDAAVVDDMDLALSQVVQRGTGVRALIGRPMAGKTGTAQEWRDAWFVGYTPDLVASVWVGFPEGQISMQPPRTRVRVTGGTFPAQIWQLFAGQALLETPAHDFPFATSGGQASTATVPAGQGGTVPALVDLTADEALARLTALGLDAEVTRVESALPEGTVLAQDPAPGVVLPAGGEVLLTVARPAGRDDVPSFLGMSRDDAAALAQFVGLDVEFIEEAEADPELVASRPLSVWKQSPGAGELLEEGDVVQLWINPSLEETSTSADP